MPHEQFDLFHGRAQIEQATTEADALGDVRAAVKLWLGTHAPRHVFVHAGVVGWHGRAIVLPGNRGAGKTTLVQAFLKNGATYLSDDMAVIDVNGCVHPYPLLLSVRDVDADLSVSRTPQQYVAASAFGAEVETCALPVGAVVFARYMRPRSDVAPTPWTPTMLSRGSAALQLVTYVVGVRRRPEFTLDSLHAVVRSAPVRLEGERSELEAVVTDVCERLNAQ